MKQTLKSLKPIWLIFLVAFLLGAACVRTPTTALPPTPSPISENGEVSPTHEPSSHETTPIVELPDHTASPKPETVLPTIPDSVEIEFLLPDYSEAFQSQVRAQIGFFTQAYPTIHVNLTLTPLSDLRTRLEVSRAAGTLPNLTIAEFNDLAVLYQHAEAQPFDAYPSLFWERYLPDSIDAVAFSNHFYGVPWFRDTCSPVYYNLVIPQGTEDQVIAAHLLAEFLTDYTFQRDNLFNLNLFPTRIDVYTNGVVGCPEFSVLRPYSEQIQTIVDSSQADSTALAELGIFFNPFAATALTPGMVGQSSELPTLARLTPASSAEQFHHEDLAFGALQIADDSLAARLGVAPGVYLVVCSPNPEEPQCSLVDTADGVHPFTPRLF